MRKLLDRLSFRRDGIFLVAALLVTGGLWAFAEIADEVMENETADLDRRLLLRMRNPADLSDPIGPAWVEEMGRDFTALGGVAVVVMMTAASLVYLLLRRQLHAAAFVAVAILGGLGWSTLLKMFFSRARPDLVPHGSFVYTASFPSGHAMLSTTVYLTLGGLLAKLEPSWVMRSFILACAAILCVLVGVSRVYLGVHWPTDVLAGWTIGATWALLCWTLATWLQRRGRIEPPAAPPADVTVEGAQ